MIDTITNPRRALVAICDECGLQVDLEARNIPAARREAKALGWHIMRDGFGAWRDVCPKCQNDLRNRRGPA